MSKRYKKRRPAAQPQRQTAADGFVNSLAYLGEASPLSRANDFVRNSISEDYNLLTTMYRESWIAARIIDTPCEDMTRSWYSISSEIDQERLDDIAKLEATHSIKQEIANAIRWGRLYGGAAAVMVIKGQEDMLDQPLDYDMLQPGCFRGLIVIDKVRGIFPGTELEEDMDDPEFGYPKYYQVTLNEQQGTFINIHHSRLLLFRGRQLPIDEEINADYWGASELEHIYEELQKRNASSANIAQLIFQANVAAMKISDYGEVMGMGTEQQKKEVMQYLFEMNRIRTSFGVLLMGNEDNYEQHPYSFAGIAEVYEAFMMDIAGAAEIPATKLFGRAPQGMNATGESDMKNYYDVIGQLQERILRPALEKLLPVMCMSEWGQVPEDLEIVFNPIGSTTPAERAEIMGKSSEPINAAFTSGIISQKTALMELREMGKPINAWTNITDEDIENADDEAAGGEDMQDPMGMMGMGGPQPGGQENQGPQAQAGLESQGQTQAQPEIDPNKVAELKERVKNLRETQAGLESGQKTQASPELNNIREAVQGLETQSRIDDPPQGIKVEPEGETQDELEKIRELRGRIEKLRETPEKDEATETPSEPPESREAMNFREEVMRAAENGDFQAAREAIERYRNNEPNMGRVRTLLHRVRELLRGRQTEDGGPGSGNFNHAGRPGMKGGSEPQGSAPVDNGPGTAYNGSGKATHGWKGLGRLEVPGPKAARQYIRTYMADHPDVARQATKYMDIRQRVNSFLQDHPEARNYNTYDAETGQVKDIGSGYCVTFHQNNTADDPLGGYSDADYAALCAIAAHELGADGVNIGYYGNPEVSFVCPDEVKAKTFAIKHNQQSVYNASTGRTLVNKQWDRTKNPIRL